MIKANELRIGNLLNAVSSLENAPLGIIEISEIKHDGIETTKYLEYAPDYPYGYSVYPFEGLVAIPLTHEWLERMGFVIGEEAAAGFIVGVNGARLQKNLTIGGWNYFDTGNFLTTIQYVHQLQNLYFALTGKELTIKP